MKLSKSVIGVICLVMVTSIAIFLWNSREKGKDEYNLSKKELSPKRKMANSSPLAAELRPNRTIADDVSSKLAVKSPQAILDEYFESESSINKRATFAMMLVNRLCYENRDQEAWQIIDKNYGTVRDSQLASYFTSANIPLPELSAKLNDLDKSDVGAFVSGIVARYDPKKLEEIISSQQGNEIFSKIKSQFNMTNFSSTIAVGIMNNETDDGIPPMERIEAAMKLKDKGYVNNTDFMNVVVNTKGVSNQEKYQIIADVDARSWNESALLKRANLVRKLLTDDPENFVDNLVSSKSVNKNIDVATSISSWTLSDPAEATKWYEKKNSYLSTSDNDLIAGVFVKESLRSREFASAKSWVNHIRSPEQREKMIAEIESIEYPKTDEQERQ